MTAVACSSLLLARGQHGEQTVELHIEAVVVFLLGSVVILSRALLLVDQRCFVVIILDRCAGSRGLELPAGSAELDIVLVVMAADA